MSSSTLFLNNYLSPQTAELIFHQERNEDSDDIEYDGSEGEVSASDFEEERKESLEDTSE